MDHEDWHPRLSSDFHVQCCDVCMPGLTHHTDTVTMRAHINRLRTHTAYVHVCIKNDLTLYLGTHSRSVEELQLKLTKANENASFLQKSIGEVTLKAEQSQQQAARKHEEEKKELEEKLLELVRRSKGGCCHCVAR